MKTKLFLLLAAAGLLQMNTAYAQNWQKINTEFNYILKGIEFPQGQSQTGWAGGESLTYMGDGIVIKTTDGGNSWTQLWTGTAKGIESISFPDFNTGYICGWSAYFAKTTNGGLTFTQQNPGTDIYYYTDVVFKSSTQGIVTAQTNTGAAVYYTTNGGTTWNTGTGLAAIPYKACYVTDNTYFLVTNGGHIQKSVNGGQTWTTVYAAGGLLLGIDFYNSQIGIAAGEDGRIIKTYDGGQTWQQQIIASGQPLWHDFAWANQNEVYACGTPEVIFKSSDGGNVWVDDYPQSTYNPALYEAISTDDGYVYICGSQGYFYRKPPQLTAQFSFSPAETCQGGSIQFTDQSVGTITVWNWAFDGGIPASSNLPDPVVEYPNPGVFDVSLTVSNANGSNTSTQANAVQIFANPIPAVDGLTEACVNELVMYSTNFNQGSAYEWEVTGGAINSGQGSNQVEVKWISVGVGEVWVRETSLNACEGISEVLTAEVSICSGAPTVENEIQFRCIVKEGSLLIIPSKDFYQNMQSLSLFNASGMRVYHLAKPQNGAFPEQLRLSDLDHGLYVLSVTLAGNVVKHFKLLI
jgi:photosystem II stability/assembly factor-like uncharacterized protein